MVDYLSVIVTDPAVWRAGLETAPLTAGNGAPLNPSYKLEEEE
jgi:hypothetical protein